MTNVYIYIYIYIYIYVYRERESEREGRALQSVLSDSALTCLAIADEQSASFAAPLCGGGG